MSTFISYGVHDKQNMATKLTTRAARVEEYNVARADIVDLTVGRGINGMLPVGTVTGYTPLEFFTDGAPSTGSTWLLNTEPLQPSLPVGSGPTTPGLITIPDRAIIESTRLTLLSAPVDMSKFTALVASCSVGLTTGTPGVTSGQELIAPFDNEAWTIAQNYMPMTTSSAFPVGSAGSAGGPVSWPVFKTEVDVNPQVFWDAGLWNFRVDISYSVLPPLNLSSNNNVYVPP